MTKRIIKKYNSKIIENFPLWFHEPYENELESIIQEMFEDVKNNNGKLENFHLTMDDYKVNPSLKNCKHLTIDWDYTVELKEEVKDE